MHRGSACIIMFNPHHHPKQVPLFQVRTPLRSRDFQLPSQGHTASKAERGFLWLEEDVCLGQGMQTGSPGLTAQVISLHSALLTKRLHLQRGVGSFSRPRSLSKGGWLCEATVLGSLLCLALAPGGSLLCLPFLGSQLHH